MLSSLPQLVKILPNSSVYHSSENRCICALLIFIGVQPPNDNALGVTLGALAATALVWFGYERRKFQGPPQGVMIQQRQAEIDQAEKAMDE